MFARTLLVVLVSAAPALLLSASCGSDGGAGGTSDAAIAPGFADVDAAQADCEGLCKRQRACVDTTTFLTGTIRDPANRLPISGAIVYVPNAQVEPLAAAPTCDRCGQVSGKPLVATLTDGTGHFVLRDVPEGPDVPLVVQIGKWRRLLTVPNVTACRINPLADIRLPRRRCEGDIPQIAVTTGGEDALECMLRDVGIDDREFTPDTAPGRVHLYAGSGTTVTSAFDAAHGGATFTPASVLWSDAARLARYDLVLLGCEGDAYAATKPASALAALESYTHAGGRVLATHQQHYWFSTAGTAFAPFATWATHPDPPPGIASTIDTTYPKGAALAAWLGSADVAALDGAGRLPLASARHDVDAVERTRATAWASFADPDAGDAAGVALLTANTPVDAAGGAQCGRVVFADLHARGAGTPGPAWPGGCASSPPSADEKALAFFFFDLAACIAGDHTVPVPPTVSTAPCAPDDKCDLSTTDTVAAQTASSTDTCDGG